MVRYTTLDGTAIPLGFKVVTTDLRSLGLRRNPNIMTFPLLEWVVLPPNMIVEGKGDYGGIWAAVDIAGARSLERYMLHKHGVQTRVFRSALRDVLYENSYRVKTSGIMLLDEL